MGNAESDLKNGDGGGQGSNNIRMLTEEEFTKLSLERQREYMAEYAKYNQRKKKDEREQMKRERRQRSVDTINAIKNRFAKSPDGHQPQQFNNFEHPLKASSSNPGHSHYRKQHSLYGPQHDKQSSQSIPPRSPNEAPRQMNHNQPQPYAYINHSQIPHSHSHPQPNSSSYSNSYGHSPSNLHPQFQAQYNGDSHDSRSNRQIQYTHQNEPNYIKHPRKPNQRINVMMYPAQPTHGSDAKSPPVIDPVKMMQSLKIEENDWETRWENDDNDDDSDEEKDQNIPMGKATGIPSHHPFRPGLDMGHSSAIPKTRTNKQPIMQNTIASSHSSTRNRDQIPPTQSLSPNSQSESSKSQWDDIDEHNLEDRPGVKMFSMLRVLGKGSFGKVVLVRKRSEPQRGNLFAMKILRKSHLLRKRQIERTKIERKVLSIVSHPFIMKLHFAFQTEDKLYFVLEYCAGGELFFHLSRYRRFPERVARFYAAELLLAIGHLHRRKIIFRDLKPENVLLDASGHVKLGDFGLSKDKITDPCKGAMSVCGTPEYMAPEVISRAGHGFCVDYWGLGMLVYEMMTSLPPWYTTDRAELSRRILSAPLEIPNYMSSVSSYFVSSLLERNPRKRLGVHGVVSVMESQFFQDINWKMLVTKKIHPEIKPCEGWKANPIVNGSSDNGQKNMSSSVIENEIDQYTSNFEQHFTRMPIHTEDYNIESQYSGSDYGSEGMPENTFVGFTFDEIDNFASTGRGISNSSSHRVRNPSSRQAIYSRQR